MRGCRDPAARRGQRFDIVLSNHVLHHLSAVELRAFADDSLGLSAGIVVHSDIRRSRLAYGLYNVGVTPFAPGTFLRTDGSRSIRRSYRVGRTRGDARRPLAGVGRVALPSSGGEHRWLTSSSSARDRWGRCSPPSSRGGSVDVALLERRARPGDGTRAIGVHAPVLAALEASGATERLLASAVRVTRGEARSDGRALGTVRFDRLRRRFPFVAALPQAATEEALAVGAPEPRRGADRDQREPGADGIRVSFGDDEALSAPIVVVAGGWRARELVYRPGGMRVRPYADRYLMADVAADRDGDLAVVNIDRSGVLESFPLPGGRRRFVAWDSSPGDERDGARAERLRAALISRGQHEAAAQVTSRDAVRRAARGGAGPAPRRPVRDRRHGARGEPHRRAGHEPRSAGCRDPRARCSRSGCAPASRPTPSWHAGRRGASRLPARRPRSPRSTRRSGGHSGAPRMPFGAPDCGWRCCRPGLDCSPMRIRWGSIATRDHAATPPPVATSCTARRSAASMTSRKSVRVGGRTSASTAVPTATRTTAPKKSQDKGRYRADDR